ncbi:MAG: Gfo/Idh/MocA family oxidoreductase [Verrucomicrobiales bacterium]
MTSHPSRRRFFEDSLLAAAAAAATSFPPRTALASDAAPVAANERIGVAVLGCGNRGKQLAAQTARHPGCELRSVCDPDDERSAALAEAVAAEGRPRPAAVRDLRQIFADPGIDAVVVATPNHWHALASIWAMEAGKDVYVEKPVSHNVREGRLMVETARRLGRICQSGTQNRANGNLRAAIRFVHEGGLGEVKLARSVFYSRRGSIGAPGIYEPPATLDYDLFQGPAPLVPLARPRLHYDWHWVWDTGNGELGNSNIHSVDICRWGLGLSGLGNSVLSYGGRFGYEDAGETPNTQVVVHDFGEKTLACETRGLPTEAYPHAHGSHWIFFGTEGIVAGTSRFDFEGELQETFQGSGENHFANFLRVMRERRHEELNADILEGHESSALCHLGNLSWRLGHPATGGEIRQALDGLESHDDLEGTLESTLAHLGEHGVDPDEPSVVLGRRLHLEPGSETFVDDPEAASLLTRDYREPYAVEG